MWELEVSVQEAKELLTSGADLRLIDCREPEEWALCRLPQAELLPLSSFGESYRSVLEDRGHPILIYCHHGVRSLHAAEYLAALGYENVRSIRGGIDAWSR